MRLWVSGDSGRLEACSYNSQQASVPGHVTFRDVASDFSLSKGSGRKREGKWMRINEKTLKTEVTVF